MKLFSAKVDDKISGKTLFINFLGSPQVAAPELDLDSGQFVAAYQEGGRLIRRYMIPFQSSPLFHGQEKEEEKGHYVILVRLNEDFWRRRVSTSVFIREYVVSVCMSDIMDKLNLAASVARTGHRFDLDHAHFSILKDKTFVEHKPMPITFM